MDITIFLILHFLPIILGIVGVIPTIFFFYKIKLPSYRVFLVFDFSVTLFFICISINELKHIFFEGAVLGYKHARISDWEAFNFLNLMRKIGTDLYIYYLYSHTKVIIKSKNKLYELIAFITKNNKIYSTTLKYGLILIVLFVLLLDIFIKKEQSITYIVIREYLRTK